MFISYISYKHSIIWTVTMSFLAITSLYHFALSEPLPSLKVYFSDHNFFISSYTFLSCFVRKPPYGLFPHGRLSCAWLMLTVKSICILMILSNEFNKSDKAIQKTARVYSFPSHSHTHSQRIQGIFSDSLHENMSFQPVLCCFLPLSLTERRLHRDLHRLVRILLHSWLPAIPE